MPPKNSGSSRPAGTSTTGQAQTATNGSAVRKPNTSNAAQGPQDTKPSGDPAVRATGAKKALPSASNTKESLQDTRASGKPADSLAVKKTMAEQPAPQQNGNAQHVSQARTSGKTAAGGAGVQRTPTINPAQDPQNTRTSGTPAVRTTAARKALPSASNSTEITQSTRTSAKPADSLAAKKATAEKPAPQLNAESLAEEILAVLRTKAKESYHGKAGNKYFRYGGPLLENKEHIDKQGLFMAAKMAPKGAHLHIHLNACLGPEVLLDLATSKKLRNNMYISVNHQDVGETNEIIKLRKDEKLLAEKEDRSPRTIKNHHRRPLTDSKIQEANFQFHFLPYGWDTTCNLFSPNYHGRCEATEKPDGRTYDVMKFTDFLAAFSKFIKTDSGINVYNGKYKCKCKANEKCKCEGNASYVFCMNWLIKKLVFQKDQVKFDQHVPQKTKEDTKSVIESRWARFNACTQMMKGLFLAEYAYCEYLKQLFSDFAKDNIQYAEVRPNFMQANSVICTSKGAIPIPNKPGEAWYDPKNTMNNEEILRMIIDVFKDWKRNHPHATLKSIKVIMCTPRSKYPGSEKNITNVLEECYRLKQKAEYKPWIAGFDFVGAELAGRTLKELDHWFSEWKQRYHDAGIKWLLHCGESIYDEDENIKYALDNLNPHRLAHGYAIQNLKLNDNAKAKLQRTCIETCPVSNEILGLAKDASCAAVYPLMKQDIPCSVSCDNPTLFNSTLSHEFYQVMVGDENFSLEDWKNLMKHSLKYSVWDGATDTVKIEVMKEWQKQYEKFLDDLPKTFPQIARQIKDSYRK